MKNQFLTGLACMAALSISAPLFAAPGTAGASAGGAHGATAGTSAGMAAGASHGVSGGTIVSTAPAFAAGSAVNNSGNHAAYNAAARQFTAETNTTAEALLLNGLYNNEYNGSYLSSETAPSVMDSGGIQNSGSYQQGTPLSAQVQAILRQQGYYLGPVDGIQDWRTEASIEAYQRDHHMPITGQINGGLIESMGAR